MLHARVDISQILDRFQIGMQITIFTPGEDPTVWVQTPLLVSLDDITDDSDTLTTILAALRLWSEMTIQG